MIWIMWLAVLAACFWSYSDKAAPFHAFVVSNSPAAIATGLAIALVLVVISVRHDKRRAARKTTRGGK